ncbi:nifu like protein [Nannochloropsis gaditana]|uniref:Nifu like protein n=1 Tax=Nannochloropsis gaditana TaxID=72520 RepID=W7TNI1_9STRA|nr:nifu like protein [Nannochloropsis gaditana]
MLTSRFSPARRMSRGRGQRGQNAASAFLTCVALFPLLAHAFLPATFKPFRAYSDASSTLVVPLSRTSTDTITSPFESGVKQGGGDDGPLPLTLENVEMVLDEMRPYLMSDGGNVVVSDIDGPVVKLELQGACGSCPSSTMTMKMGLERRLKEKIPEISEVIQAMPEGPALSTENIDQVLEGVRPFLMVAGGSISVKEISGLGGLQPLVLLHMEGNNQSLFSVRMEITQRILRNFMVPGLRVEWTDQVS